jgi:hypothetical protein
MLVEILIRTCFAFPWSGEDDFVLIFDSLVADAALTLITFLCATFTLWYFGQRFKMNLKTSLPIEFYSLTQTGFVRNKLFGPTLSLQYFDP